MLLRQVFEAGLAAVPLSVDLWLHYLHHMRTVHEGKPEVVRAAFERAIDTCGTEFRSVADAVLIVFAGFCRNL